MLSSKNSSASKLVIFFIPVNAISRLSIIFPRKGVVDFGHKQGKSYNTMFQKYKNREISLDELKEFQYNPDNYRLETPSANRGHLYE